MNAAAFTYQAHNSCLPVTLDDPKAFQAAHPWWRVIWCLNCHHRSSDHSPNYVSSVRGVCPGCSGCFEGGDR